MFWIKGDWPFYWQEHLSSFTLPEIWSSVWPTGLGGNQAIILPLKLYLEGVVALFVNNLGIPWEIVQIIFFFGLFFVLSIYASFRLTKSYFGSLIYTTNTWILLVFFGGQMGIALAYAIAPLVLKIFINLIENTVVNKNFQFQISNFKFPMMAGLIFAIEVMFDMRIALLTGLVVLGYVVFHHVFIQRINFKLFIIHYSLVIILVVLLHAFWILPSVFIALRGGNVANIVDTTYASLEFFSFAKFENSLSLLHPNWPENIFGKVAFMKPEFLIIPILAFSSLLFFRNSKQSIIEQSSNLPVGRQDRAILFFALMGLASAFLAKGTQEPFGFVFNFLYSNIPGFNLFRDPVKFYMLVALAYSILIPYSIRSLGGFKKIAFVAFVFFWAYLNWPFIVRSNSGIFKQRQVPQEYVRLKEFLVSRPEFFRTLWIPSVQRFAFMSDNHPTLAFQEIFKSKKLDETVLRDMAVKYIIVPYDSEGEIFLNDRKYDDKLYQKTIAELNKITWLKKIERHGKIAVYELSNPKPHRFVLGNKLIFSESFDKFWYAEFGEEKVYSKPHGMLNSFEIPQNQRKSLTLSYEPQKWANVGSIVSGLTLLIVIGIIYTSSRRK
ncbi:MAG: hypothetical protein HY427_00075 [Candidatus Levybacteria bacterium]|nr:hypothetical protein [Candidatus Levybacteria bacterium]